MNRPIVYQAASVCLSYPDDTVLGLAPVVRRALELAMAEPPGPVRTDCASGAPRLA